MKLEMGESLGMSWMRHVKSCQMVQLNWKVSPMWQEKHPESDLSKLLNDIKDQFGQDGFDIFKKNANLQQFIHQTECDVMGCRFDAGNKFFFLEVAFHGNTLNYGSRCVTISKIIAKLTRAAVTSYCFLGIKDAEIAFASPKIGDSILAELEKGIAKLQTIFNRHNFNFAFNLYANKSFQTEILNPVLAISNKVNDTAELFLRSLQLVDMFADCNSDKKIESENSSLPDSTDSEQSIGNLVKFELRPILQQDDFPQEEVNDFLNKQYSKDVFNLNYPLLSETRDAARYYKEPVKIHGKDYFLCNDWYDNRNRRPLLAWIELHTPKDD